MRALAPNLFGGDDLPEAKFIEIIANYRHVKVDIRTIQYVFINQNVAEIHVAGGQVYKTRVPMKKIEAMLGDDFIKVHRRYLVSVMAIHDITDRIVLNNGEELNYVLRRKKEITAELQEKRQRMFKKLNADMSDDLDNEYHERYRVFDDLPIAFTDIEVILDEKNNAVDWIFRYGNTALAQLEKIPLENLLGRTFSSVFPNMDEKWLRSYERAALYRQTLEIIDYSPEIDTYLDIICFPTQKGHCGCILLNIGEMQYAENQGDSQNARIRYFAKLLEKI